MADEKKKMSKGCMIALIVGAVIIVAIAASAFYCYKNADKFVELGLNSIANDVQKYLPEDITKEMVDEQIDKFMTAFREKKIEGIELQNLMQMGSEIVNNKDLGEDELKTKALDFYEELKRIADK
ncbi:MAG: hypothetical protein ABIJ45_00545 [Candidatus Zixiibacteriota bacterium]